MARHKKSMKSSSDYAHLLDEQDNLKEFRSLFHIPQKNGKDTIYFCGHSLGLQPKKTRDFVLLMTFFNRC